MKLMVSFWVLLLHNIDLSHIHNTLHCCLVAVCSDAYIKEQLSTFLYFAILNALVNLVLVSNDPSAISNQLPFSQGGIKTGCRLLSEQ